MNERGWDRDDGSDVRIGMGRVGRKGRKGREWRRMMGKKIGKRRRDRRGGGQKKRRV